VYFGRSATGDTFVNSLVANNAFTGGGGVSLPNNSGTPSINNVNLSDSQAVNSFLSYAAGNISNDYHLKSGATNLIGRGTNLFSCFTNDFAGNARPSSGNWDIGPYVYGGGGGGGGSTNPVILVSPASLDFGLLLANTSTNLTLTVENKGGGTLTGVASVSSPFQIVSGGNYSLGSNQAQTVTVKFNPAAAGTFNQTINFTGGNGANSTLGGLAYVIQSSLSFSSSAGTIVAPFTVASLGTTNYISQTATTGLSDGGKAIYGFSIATAGNYMVSTVVNTPNTAANSFYLNIDGQPTDPTMIWDNPVTSGFTNLLASWRGTGTDTNNQFAPKVFNLSAGTHQLIVRGREGGAGLAGISILPYAVPTAPLGLHVVNP
jgi:hypothetical protein